MLFWFYTQKFKFYGRGKWDASEFLQIMNPMHLFLNAKNGIRWFGGGIIVNFFHFSELLYVDVEEYSSQTLYFLAKICMKIFIRLLNTIQINLIYLLYLLIHCIYLYIDLLIHCR